MGGDLEQRLEGLADFKPALLEVLGKERINFADRRNWHLLPREEGGQRYTVRSWKYAWSNTIIKYFDSIGAPLSYDFRRGLYEKLNKDVMKRPVYGILSYPNVPAEIYQRLTEWEKLCFIAGAYKKGGTEGLEDKPLAEIVHTYVKEGIDYLHATHAVKKAVGQYKTRLKIPGSQHYRKTKATNRIADDIQKLEYNFQKLLMTEARKPNYENHERVAMFLEGCDEEARKHLTNKFGARKLGGYAVPLQKQDEQPDLFLPF